MATQSSEGNPTRVRTMRTHDDGGFDERETAALASVEIGETAKGDIQIKSVKVYHNDPSVAANTAWQTYQELKRSTEKGV